jgi:outer membrane protein assembly factor BamE (lipoprotein component of BamABCDE complex)/ketosteroid isomerase-like protein
VFCPLLGSPAYYDCETTWYINVCFQYTDYKVNPMRNSIFFVLVVASLGSGCGAKLPSMKPFKMEVQQGNVVTSKMLLQLRPGMTRSQVRYIMGTPLIVDSFRDNRWDYFYELRKQGSVVEKRRVILDFDKDSLLAVRGDVIPSAENPEIKTIAETPKQKVDDAKDQSWSDKLKFWKGDEAAKAGAAGAGAAAIATEENKTNAVATPPAPVNQPDNPESASPQVTAAPSEPAPAPAKISEADAAKASASATISDDEVVPHIPEGEYAGAPTPQEMAKGNLDASANQAAEANAHAVNEKTLAAKAAETVEPPPVFEQQAVAAPAVVAEPEPVLPPPAKVTPPPAPAAKSVLVPVKPAVAAAPVAIAAAAKATPSKQASSKPVDTKPAVPAATPKQTGITIVKTKDPALIDDDEVIPYIAEGEYVEQVIPTEGEMIKGNMAEANAPAIDAEARQVTEKGVAPKESNEAAEPPPTFVAEQLPEPEPEPELPPPPVKSAPKANAAVATGASLAAAETKPASVLKPAAPQADKLAPVAETATQASAATDASVNQSVAAWAQAWRSKDVNAYFAAYAPEFVPDGVPSKKAWESQRKQRLSAKQGEITLVLNGLQVQRDGGEAVVQFEQKYATKSYKDELLKTLELRYEPAQKRWLITRERTAPLGSAAVPAVVALPNKAAVAVPPASETKVEIPVEAEPSVESAIETWAQAWRSKNINTYLAAYSPEFVPEDLPNKRAWEAQRKKRLSPNQGNISLEIDAVNVTRDGDNAVATFTQKYAAKAYRDVMVKKLQLKLDPATKNWLIVRETATTATDLPAAKQQLTTPPAATEASPEQSDAAPEQIGF